MNCIKRWIRIFKWLWSGGPMITYEGYWCGCCGRYWPKLLVIPAFDSQDEWWDTWGLCPKGEGCRIKEKAITLMEGEIL